MNSFCNSLYKSNIALFKSRFSSLYSMLEKDILAFESGSVTPPFDVTEAKNGSISAVSSFGALHSKYNPEREASQIVDKFDADSCSAACFLSFGLGYVPIAFCKAFPNVPAVIFEQDVFYMLFAFCFLDWTSVFSHNNIVFAVGAPLQSVETILSQYDASSLYFFCVPSQAEHCKSYFDGIRGIVSKAKQKDATNTNTLEKFGHLWLSNTMKNLRFLDTLDGIEKYRLVSLEQNIPFVVLAAGPSLQKVLPVLADIKKRAILVCVDTALHSCLEYGVEPDFIVLVDPQYACAMHLEFLSSPSSVLITECAAWPSVFRFPCKEKVLCSSMYPPGMYFEKQLGSKGRLGAGGSVATTAWDFARYCGAKNIYIAGMDLGFPGKQTHIRGSQFEERALRVADRLYTAEFQNVQTLMGANPFIAKDYDGNSLLSDKKMSLFAWWFEKNTAIAKEDGVSTYSLTKESLAINGIESFDLDKFLSFDIIDSQKERFFDISQNNASILREKKSARASFDEVYESFKENMNILASAAKKGISLCDKGIKYSQKAASVFAELEKIDSTILTSKAKDAAALVFPTERRLKELSKDFPEDKTLYSLYYSRTIYTQLLKAVSEYLELCSD